MDNWADDNFDHAALDFIGGGNLWVYSDSRPIAAAGHEHVRPRASLGRGLEIVHQGECRSSEQAYLQKTTLPYEDNYLDLDPEVKDPLGYPVCRITADYKENERRLAAFIQDKMEQWYRAAGAIGDRAQCHWHHGAVHARLRRDADGR